MCALSAPASVFSYRNIYQRYLECRKNKRNSINALKFEIHAGENILDLENQLKNHTYHPSRSVLFAAKKPKLREIFAANFTDRVVHHVLVHYLEKIWEPVFIHDSYACRIGKGTHKAVSRLQSFLRKATCNGNVRAYYLQLDIKDFFMSIDKEILHALLQKRVKNPDILWLIKTVLFWDCTRMYVTKGDKELLANVPPNKSLFGRENKTGLPIGNLTSQFFANVFLDQFDQYVKHTLKAKYYIRYVDDFVIISQDREELIRFRAEIDAFLTSKLKLTLHPKRHKLLTVSSGIDFLGYIIRHNYILVRRRVLNNLKQKISEFIRSEDKNVEKFNATLASYAGHLKHGNVYRLKKSIKHEIQRGIHG